MSDTDFEDFDPYEGLADLTGDEPVPPLEHPAVPPASPPRSPLLTGLIIAVLLVVATVAVFQLLRNDEEPVAGPGTTAAVPTTGGAGTGAPTTDATGDTTTTAPEDGSATDPTQSDTPFEPYAPVGEPLPISALTLAVDGIGPIEFGRRAERAIGRLVASLGEPDADSGPIISTGAFGGCEGEPVRIVRWGALVAVVVIDDDGSEIFGGYRVDLAYEDAFSSETTELATLSGLKVGDSIRRIEQIYESFDRRFVVHPELGDTFELYSANTGNLLLWGPITSPEPSGIVRGIYSPDACGRFQ